jgi:hypothetical protein
MRTRRGLVILLGAFVGLIALANVARQSVSPPYLLNVDGEHVGFGQSYTLNKPTLDDIVAFAETINIQPLGQIDGDAALVGGTINIEGRITGDLAVMGDKLTIHPGAEISGDATLLVSEVVLDGQIAGVVNVRGDSLEIMDGAQLRDDVFACASTVADARTDARSVRPCSESPAVDNLEFDLDQAVIRLPVGVSISSPLSPLSGLVISVLGSLAFSGLAILAVIIFPRQISHIEEAIMMQAPRLVGIGLLLFLFVVGVTFAVLVVLSIVPPLGLILVPLYLLAGLLFTGMLLAGWITVTLICGQLLLRRFDLKLPPLMMAVAGNFAIVIVWHFLMLIPLTRPLALLLLLALAAVGLGATALTRMGTRPLHKSYLVQG